MNEYLYLGHEEDEKNDIYFLSQTLKKKKKTDNCWLLGVFN